MQVPFLKQRENSLEPQAPNIQEEHKSQGSPGDHGEVENKQIDEMQGVQVTR